MQKLVDTAKSIANQVLQAPAGYTTKSTVSSSALAGTAADLVDGTVLAATDVLDIAASAGHAAFSFTFTATTSLADLNTALAASESVGQPRQHQPARHYDDQRYGFVHNRCGYVHQHRHWYRDLWCRWQCAGCRCGFAGHSLEFGEAI